MVSSTNLNSYIQSYSSGQRKISVPVASSAVMYSQFQYVSGYATSKNTDGISVDRVHILDTLINQLISAKKTNIKIPAFEQMTNSQADKLIIEYQGQIARNIDTAKSAVYVEKPAAPAGIVFDLTIG